jgi:hypothetical protein
MITALEASLLTPAIFVSIAFSSETLYLWSGSGSVTWNSQTWLGAGSILGFTTPEDAATIEAKGITLNLSAFDPTLLSECLTDIQLGTPVTIYLGLYSGGSLVDSPVTAWAGRLDKPTVTIGSTDGLLEINCENRLLDMNISVDRRWTNDDLQALTPGDLGCSFVASLTEKTTFWGAYPQSTNNV